MPVVNDTIVIDGRRLNTKQPALDVRKGQNTSCPAAADERFRAGRIFAVNRSVGNVWVGSLADLRAAAKAILIGGRSVKATGPRTIEKRPSPVSRFRRSSEWHTKSKRVQFSPSNFSTATA